MLLMPVLGLVLLITEIIMWRLKHMSEPEGYKLCSREEIYDPNITPWETTDKIIL